MPVEAFVAEALEVDRLLLALGTAIRFEAVLRQNGGIGGWASIPADEVAIGIIHNGRRWKISLT